MAIDLAAHRDKKELNSKLPSKEFIKKYKWWLVGGLAIGLERLTSQVLGLRNIREATLNPRDINRLEP